MATYMLVDGNEVVVQPSEEVTFQLPSFVSGQVPVTIPYEVFGSANQFTLENPGDPSATRTVPTSTQWGSFLVTWLTDEGSSSGGDEGGGSGSEGGGSEGGGEDAKRQHQGTIRVGSATSA